jgi:hypothetical protein
MLGQAIFIVSYVVRDALWPNVVKVVTLVGYAAVLVGYQPRDDLAVSFARTYALAQAVYALLMGSLALAQVYRHRIVSVVAAHDGA